MSRFAFMFVMILASAPLPARADCAADLAKVQDDAKSTGFDIAKTPRAKALVDKANLAAANKDKKTCAETVKGLHQLMGKSE
jgi:hypothetical protein